MFLLVLVISIQSVLVQAQSSEFTYQGKLTVSGAAASGQYDLIFRLFDVEVGGTEVSAIPSTIDNVQVTAGIFTVVLDFGQAFPVTERRWLQIEVRPGESTGDYTKLNPRQKITAAPQAISALTAETANTANTANDANTVGGFAPEQLIKEGDLRLTDARQPLAGSPSYVQIGPPNTQSGGFDISGNGKIGSSLTVVGSTFLNSNLSVGGTITGNGSGLTNINGANIANNTINASALAPNAVPSNYNLKLLGSLRWDLLQHATFAVGDNPVGIAFDGANVWVANRDSNSLQKLRASDGLNLGAVTVGSAPIAVTVDGTSVWVANDNSNNVMKLNAISNNLEGTFAVGTNPRALAFDGANIWVANFTSNNVTKLRASDGALQGTFAVGTNPQAIAFDGTSIWVVNIGSKNLTKLRASDGTLEGTILMPNASYIPQAVVFDGANIWVTHGAGVFKLRQSDGVFVGNFVVSNNGSNNSGMAFDGANIWVANTLTNRLTKLHSSDGAFREFTISSPGVTGVAFDGANIWVTNSASDTVTRLPAFP